MHPRSGEEDRARWYLHLVFALFLVAGSGSLYLRMGYLISAGLLKGPGYTDLMGNPVGCDFVLFWSAAQLARAGTPAAAYSIDRLHPVEERAVGASIPRFPWVYPPTFLLLLLPLAWLSYPAALIAWLGMSLYGVFRVIRGIAPHSLVPWLFLAFPGVVINFFAGQNAFLSTALLGGGLLLVDRHPWLAGCLLGLLSYKPQLAVLIPVALVAGRQWRALGGAAAATASLALASLFFLGSDPWVAFFASLPEVSRIATDAGFRLKMVTFYPAALSLGAGMVTAGLLQGLAALGAAAAVVWAWSRKLPMALRGSLLAMGILLGTPYALEYDLTLLALAFAWLGWEEYTRRRIQGEAFLMACWAGLFFAGFAAPQMGFQASPLIILALLGFALWRTRRADQAGAAVGA